MGKEEEIEASGELHTPEVRKLKPGQMSHEEFEAMWEERDSNSLVGYAGSPLFFSLDSLYCTLSGIVYSWAAVFSGVYVAHCNASEQGGTQGTDHGWLFPWRSLIAPVQALGGLLQAWWIAPKYLGSLPPNPAGPILDDYLKTVVPTIIDGNLRIFHNDNAGLIPAIENH